MQNTKNIAGDHATRRSVFARLRADQRGAALLEFAFVAPMLLALLLAIVDTSLQFFAQQNLESVNEKAARLLLTGQAKTNNWSESDFKTQVCNRLPSFMQCAKTIVEVRRASSFDSIDTTRSTITVDATGKPTGGSGYNYGTAGDIVMVRISYLWPIKFAPFDFGSTYVNYGGRRLMVSTTVIKTEPYQ